MNMMASRAPSFPCARRGLRGRTVGHRVRGSSIDQLSLAAILAHARQQAGRLSAVPGDVIGGVAVDAVTLIPTEPAADVGLTREVIELSTATHLPMRVLGYDGVTLVRNVEFSNVQLQG